MSSKGLTLASTFTGLLVAAAVAVGQVPTKPPPKDTAKVTQAGKAKTPAQPIKISKESTAGGEVVPLPEIVTKIVPLIDPKRDDSIRAAQHAVDSAATAQMRARLMRQMRNRVAAVQEEFRTEMLARKEAERAALARLLERGWYLGIGGGASAPQRALRNGYTGGYNVTLPFGYDATLLPLGVRADVSVDHMNGTRLLDASHQTLAASGDITMWSGSLDLKLRLPVPGVTRTHFYALGGLGAHRLTGGVYGTTAMNAGSDLSFADAKTKLGWNAGAGAAIPLGRTEIFIESRFFQVKTDLPYNMAGGVGTYASFTPVLIGVQWY